MILHGNGNTCWACDNCSTQVEGGNFLPDTWFTLTLFKSDMFFEHALDEWHFCSEDCLESWMHTASRYMINTK